MNNRVFNPFTGTFDYVGSTVTSFPLAFTKIVTEPTSCSFITSSEYKTLSSDFFDSETRPVFLERASFGVKVSSVFALYDEMNRRYVVPSSLDNTLLEGYMYKDKTKGIVLIPNKLFFCAADKQMYVFDGTRLRLDVDSLQSSLTYAELRTLIENSLLIPGMKYRITDYETIIDTSYHIAESGVTITSANHPFDLIVTATSSNTLDCNAQAVLREGDTYFINSELHKWKIKYNVGSGYSQNKGIIYYMKDQNGNEAPYDFKNIQFTFTEDYPYPILNDLQYNTPYYTFTLLAKGVTNYNTQVVTDTEDFFVGDGSITNLISLRAVDGTNIGLNSEKNNIIKIEDYNTTQSKINTIFISKFDNSESLNNRYVSPSFHTTVESRNTFITTCIKSTIKAEGIYSGLNSKIVQKNSQGDIKIFDLSLSKVSSFLPASVVNSSIITVNDDFAPSPKGVSYYTYDQKFLAEDTNGDLYAQWHSFENNGIYYPASEQYQGSFFVKRIRENGTMDTQLLRYYGRNVNGSFGLAYAGKNFLSYHYCTQQETIKKDISFNQYVELADGASCKFFINTMNNDQRVTNIAPTDSKIYVVKTTSNPQGVTFASPSVCKIIWVNGNPPEIKEYHYYIFYSEDMYIEHSEVDNTTKKMYTFITYQEFPYTPEESV